MKSTTLITSIPKDEDTNILSNEIKTYLEKNHKKGTSSPQQEVVVYIKVMPLKTKASINYDLRKNLKLLEKGTLSLSGIKDKKSAYAEAKVVRTLHTHHQVELTYGIRYGKYRCKHVTKYKLERNPDGSIKNRVYVSTTQIV